MKEATLGLFLISTGVTIIVIFVLWNLVWKGLALWKAAKNGSKTWFILLLIFNTLGILEILYIFYFNKRHTLEKFDKNIDSATEKIKENFSAEDDDKKVEN